MRCWSTCQTHLLTTAIEVDEDLLCDQNLWMALDRTRYMQSAKTFVMVDRPFWHDIDPATGRPAAVDDTDRPASRGAPICSITARTSPAVICLSYSWMTDALKVLPLSADKRVDLALQALAKIYPGVDIASHIRGKPICVSWEADENFLGAFKGALPGHYRYNYRMYGHFMQPDLPPEPARPVPRRRRRQLDPRLGRGRGADSAQRRLGDHDAFRRQEPRVKSRTRRSLPRAGADFPQVI